MYEVRIIEDPIQWNDFIKTAKYGHLCQTFEWPDHGEIVGLRQKALRVGLLKDGALVGAVLLLASPAGGLPGHIFYAPRGPVVDSLEGPELGELMRGAAKIARSHGGVALRIEPHIAEDDPLWRAYFQRLGFHETDSVIYLRNTWILDIRPPESELLAGMKMTWRYNVHFAERKGVVVRQGTTEEDFQRFYELQTETSQREHFYLYPPTVFRDMLAHYSAEAARERHTAELVLLVAEYQGEIIGATTEAFFGAYALSMHTGLSDLPAHRKVKPNYLMQWECIKLAKERGCSYYDFRNIPEKLEPGQPMYGVYEFKRGFGGFMRRMAATMDLPLNPLLYYPYVWMTNARNSLRNRQTVSAPAGGGSAGPDSSAAAPAAED